MAFVRTRPVTLRMTDAAGVLFFAEQLALVHDVEEELFADVGFPVGAVLRAGRVAFPVVHCETDFFGPLIVDDVVTVTLSIARLGETSFAVRHTLAKDGRVVGRGRIVHACIDRATRQKSALPEALRAGLTPHVDDETSDDDRRAS